MVNTVLWKSILRPTLSKHIVLLTVTPNYAKFQYRALN